VLQWDDFIIPMVRPPVRRTTLNIYLTNDNGSVLLGTNRNNIGGDPIEVLPLMYFQYQHQHKSDQGIGHRHVNFNTLFSVAILPSTNITKATPPSWATQMPQVQSL